MAYEYGTQGATLDFPNPYRVENQFLLLRALVLLAGALGLLAYSRTLAGGPGGWRLALLVAGGALLALASLLEFGRAARQLRVFFGRGQPPSLASDLSRDVSGTSPRAQLLAETLRQGAIPLAEPSGPLNGVLYSLVRHLVTGPRTLRDFVEVRFANLVAVLGLLLLFALTWWLTPQPAARALAAGVYVLLGGALIVRTYLSGREGVVALRPLALVGLLVFALVGTLLVGRVAAGWHGSALLDGLSLPTIALVLLAASALVEALGLVAGRAHLDPPPPAASAGEQVAVSFNADPNLLMQEVDRELQRRWTEGIPNRRYLWQSPQVEPAREAGNFAGAVLEESQPMPPQAVRRMDWSTCLAFPRFTWLALLDGLGLVFTLAGCGLWLKLGAALADGDAALPWSHGSIGAILVVTGGYALRAAHRLWGRLDFESTVTWIEFTGSYARAQVGLGAAFTDRVKSERAVVNVESMTLRAWVVKARSVIFDYRDTDVGARVLVGMSGDADAARAWVQLVRGFAAAQSMVVVPGNAQDAQRLENLAAANRLAGTAPPAVLMAAAAAPAVPAPRHCTACGAAQPAGARFCHQCGQALLPAG